MAYLLQESPGDYPCPAPSLYLVPPRSKSGRLRKCVQRPGTVQSLEDEEYKSATDAALVLRAQAGDEAAFEELIRRYEAVVRVVAFRGSEAKISEDVVQDAFLKAFANLHRLEKPALFRSWLLQITANRARDYLRMETRRSRFLKEAGPQLVARGRQANGSQRNGPVGTPMERQELKDRITRQVEALPEPYQQVACMRYLEDRSYPEIAEELGVPEKVVKQRMWRARTILRVKLRKWKPMPQA